MTRKVLFIALCALAVVGCKKESAETVDLENLVVTGEATEVSPFAATLSASFYPVSPMDVGEECIYLSEDSNTSGYMRCGSWYDEKEGTRRYRFTSLEPETTYYYWAGIRYSIGVSDKETLGEVRSFTTLPFKGDLVKTEDPVVEPYELVLRGSVPEMLRDAYGVWGWIEWGEINPDSGEKQSSFIEQTTIKENCTFEYRIVRTNKSIFFRAGLRYNDISLWGEEKTWSDK